MGVWPEMGVCSEDSGGAGGSGGRGDGSRLTRVGDVVVRGDDDSGGFAMAVAFLVDPVLLGVGGLGDDSGGRLLDAVLVVCWELANMDGIWEETGDGSRLVRRVVGDGFLARVVGDSGSVV